MQLETWQKELRRCVSSIEGLNRYAPKGFLHSSQGLLGRNDKGKDLMQEVVKNMRLSITPHTLKLIDWNDPRDPLLLMAVPRSRELDFSADEVADPIGDDKCSPVPFLVHRYPDRALIHVNYVCAGCCRFCFRRSKTGRANVGPSAKNRDDIVAYLKQHAEVEEAILSGGDPLMLADKELANWIAHFKTVKTLRRIRIHTRLPVTLPSRISPKLVRMLKSFQTNEFPIYMVTHFNHPKEIAKENIDAIARLVDAGIVVRNQSVLLKGVNDNLTVMRDLLRRLVDVRIVPYYIHQLDKAQGTSHFRVPVKDGIKLMKSLRGKVTGIALPKYVMDCPDGAGKIVMNDS